MHSAQSMRLDATSVLLREPIRDSTRSAVGDSPKGLSANARKTPVPFMDFNTICFASFRMNSSDCQCEHLTCPRRRPFSSITNIFRATSERALMRVPDNPPGAVHKWSFNNAESTLLAILCMRGVNLDGGLYDVHCLNPSRCENTN